MARKRLTKNDCWIVVSAYNEHRHIAEVVKRILKQGFKNIVVMDDGSRDKTGEIALRAGATVLRNIINMHKGASMKTGSEYALKQGAKAIIYLDGDGQHAPEELPHFLKELNNDHDIVFGARWEKRKMPLQRRMGKILTGTAVKLLYGIDITDTLSGYRGLTAAAYRKIRWNSRDYLVESEMIARTGLEGLKYTEITISTIYHDRYKGVTFLHGFPILWKLLWWRITG